MRSPDERSTLLWALDHLIRLLSPRPERLDPDQLQITLWRIYQNEVNRSTQLVRSMKLDRNRSRLSWAVKHDQLLAQRGVKERREGVSRG